MCSTYCEIKTSVYFSRQWIYYQAKWAAILFQNYDLHAIWKNTTLNWYISKGRWMLVWNSSENFFSNMEEVWQKIKHKVWKSGNSFYELHLLLSLLPSQRKHVMSPLTSTWKSNMRFPNWTLSFVYGTAWSKHPCANPNICKKKNKKK